MLTGGGSKLQGIAELGRKIIQLPVRVGTPPYLDDDTNVLYDPACATGIGLMYWKIRQAGSKNWEIRKGGLEVLLPKWLGYINNIRLANVKG